MNGLAWGIALVSVSAATELAVRSLDAPAPDDGRIDAIAERMATLEERLEQVDGRIAKALARAESPERAAARASGPAVADAGTVVESPLLAAAERDAAAAAEEAAEETEDEFDLEAFAARLRAGGMSDEEVERAWRKIVAAGRVDDAIDLLEELAELHPNDPDLQAHLGSAYIQKLMTVPDLQRGEPAMRADAAFDAALKLDPQHWDARFSKAISLSFWPPIMGKQPEAIRQFETLLAQQEGSGAPEPKHAQTYQFLGNLYLQSGQVDKAKEVFAKGLSSFPGNEALAQAMAGL
ncbi:MAG: tetratricopeptide repeat protein [Planctomycetota bacterium JB042]